MIAGVRPRGSRVYGGAWGSGMLPLWARWNGRAEHRYTIGVEEELMLLGGLRVTRRRRPVTRFSRGSRASCPPASRWRRTHR